MGNKLPKQKFEWYWGTCCRYHVHAFPDPIDGAHCVCGLTNIRQRRGGWDAVWNAEGVKIFTELEYRKLEEMRKLKAEKGVTFYTVPGYGYRIAVDKQPSEKFPKKGVKK